MQIGPFSSCTCGSMLAYGEQTRSGTKNRLTPDLWKDHLIFFLLNYYYYFRFLHIHAVAVPAELQR